MTKRINPACLAAWVELVLFSAFYHAIISPQLKSDASRMSDSELDPTEIIAQPLAVGVVGWFVGCFVLASLVVRFLVGAWRWRGLRGISLLEILKGAVIYGVVLPWMVQIPIFSHPALSFLVLLLFFFPAVGEELFGEGWGVARRGYEYRAGCLGLVCLLVPLDHGMQEQRFPAFVILGIGGGMMCSSVGALANI